MVVHHGVTETTFIKSAHKDVNMFEKARQNCLVQPEPILVCESLGNGNANITHRHEKSGKLNKYCFRKNLDCAKRNH